MAFGPFPDILLQAGSAPVRLQAHMHMILMRRFCKTQQKSGDRFGTFQQAGLMEETISRSEKKRRSRKVENLARELMSLSDRDMAQISCPALIKEKIVAARGLKGGALKRQVKYVAKILRQEKDTIGDLLVQLEEKKGSKLKADSEFHELERLREAIITQAIALHDERRIAEAREHPGPHHRPAGQANSAIDEAMAVLPGLAAADLQRSAMMYAMTRKPVYRREIFRILRAALERRQYERKKRGAPAG
jgi:ribosome-associated protein